MVPDRGALRYRSLRQEEATDWLLALIEKEHPHAVDAHEALCRSAPSAATIERLI